MKETELRPIERTVRVPAEPEAAFRRFTEELGDWWPLGTHSVGGEAAETAVMEGRVGGRIMERTRSGEEHVWGTVLEWDAPRRLVFTWHPGRPSSTAQTVTVMFEAVEGGTELRLVHAGWERFGSGVAETREQYGPGWDFVLGRYLGGLTG